MIELTKKQREYLDKRFENSEELYDRVTYFGDMSVYGSTFISIKTPNGKWIAFDEDYLKDVISLTVYPNDIEVEFKRRL